MLNLGLCCLLHSSKEYKFRTYTRARLETLDAAAATDKVHEVLRHNAKMLGNFFDYCRSHGIKSYRLSSDLIPHFKYITQRGLVTQSDLKYFRAAFGSHNTSNLCLSMHPGQHVALGSNRPEVIQNSIDDLKYHQMICDSVGFKEMNIHLGGAYGDKESALARFCDNAQQFVDYLTVENDELTYSIDDCLFVAKQLKIPVTFDLHHHRCHQLKPEYVPSMSEHEYFLAAKQTWIASGRDFMRVHISTPKSNYTTAAKSRPHHDYISPQHVPDWLLEEAKQFPVFVDVEAKAKEKAIFQLSEELY